MMATILKGKNKGKEVVIDKWRNDWVVTSDGRFRVDQLQYTPKEIMTILMSDTLGTMLTKYNPTFDFRFVQKGKNGN